MSTMHWHEPIFRAPSPESGDDGLATRSLSPLAAAPGTGTGTSATPPAPSSPSSKSRYSSDSFPIIPHRTPTIKNHSATYHDGIIYVYGGYDGRRNHSTLCAFDVRRRCWRSIDPRCVSGTPPPGRNGHTATLAIFGDGTAHVVIIGGWLGTGPLAASDTHVLDVTNGVMDLQWICPEVGGTPPGPCNMHSADYIRHGEEVYVFRGGNGREYLNDLHALDVTTYVWRKVQTNGAMPKPRANHSSAVVERTGELFIFGGWNGKERLNDIHVLDTKNNTWSTPHVCGVLPQPRAGMTLTPLRDRLFLFGGSGTSSKCFHDLQIFDRNEMTWLDVNVQEENFETPANKSPPISEDHDDEGESESAHHVDSSLDPLERLRADSLAAHRRWSHQNSSNLARNANPNDEDSVETVTTLGLGPGRRAGHTATAVGRNIYIFGGSCGSDYLSDFFVLDTDPPPTVRVSVPSCQQLLDRRLKHFFDDEKFSDVTFLVEGRRVCGHRIILSLVSDCFRAMFSTGFMESTASEIEISDCSADAFLQMMEYLYKGKIPEIRSIGSGRGGVRRHAVATDAGEVEDVDGYDPDGVSFDVSNAIQLLELADRYMLDHLKQVCEKILQPVVDGHTYAYMLDVALRMNASQLERVCRFYERNRMEDGEDE